jgi:hypothetical protein
MIPDAQMQAAIDAAQAKTIADAFRILDAIEAKARATTPGYNGVQEANDRVSNAVRIYCALISNG